MLASWFGFDVKIDDCCASRKDLAARQTVAALQEAAFGAAPLPAREAQVPTPRPAPRRGKNDVIVRLEDGLHCLNAAEHAALEAELASRGKRLVPYADPDYGAVLVPAAKPKAGLCMFFKKGQCAAGLACKFAHYDHEIGRDDLCEEVRKTLLSGTPKQAGSDSGRSTAASETDLAWSRGGWAAKP